MRLPWLHTRQSLVQCTQDPQTPSCMVVAVVEIVEDGWVVAVVEVARAAVAVMVASAVGMGAVGIWAAWVDSGKESTAAAVGEVVVRVVG